MAIQLKKGGNISLSKEAPGMKKMKLGLGWDTSKFDSDGQFDLDVTLFCLETNDKGPILKTEKDFIFYGNLSNENGSIVHKGDNRTGAGDGDDETIEIDLSGIREGIENVSVIVSIYDAANRRQNFGMVSNAFIKLYNMDTNEIIAQYDLTEDFATETSVQFGSLYKNNGEWKFKAVGAGYNAGLDAFIKEYQAEALLG